MYDVSYYMSPGLFELIQIKPIQSIRIIDGTRVYTFELTAEQAVELMAVAKCAAQK